MRLGQFFIGIRRFMAKLKPKWSDYWSEVLQSIAQEEMRIPRVEIEQVRRIMVEFH